MELSEEHHRKMDKEAVKLEQMDKQIEHEAKEMLSIVQERI